MQHKAFLTYDHENLAEIAKAWLPIAASTIHAGSSAPTAT